MATGTEERILWDALIKMIMPLLSRRKKKNIREILQSINAYTHIYTQGVTLHNYSDSVIKSLLEAKDDRLAQVVGAKSQYQQLVELNIAMTQSIESHISYVSERDRGIVETHIKDLNDLIIKLNSISGDRQDEIASALYGIAKKSKELYEVGHLDMTQLVLDKI